MPENNWNRWVIYDTDEVRYEMYRTDRKGTQVIQTETKRETYIVRVCRGALTALNTALEYAGDWEEAANGDMVIHHQGFELNVMDVLDFLLCCYFQNRDPVLAEALQARSGLIVYGCAPTGVIWNKDYEYGLELFKYKTGQDFDGRHYASPDPVYYPRRPRLEELVWVNKDNMPEREEEEEYDK